MTYKFIAHIKRWFDKYNGNSYFSVRIFDMNDKLISVNFDLNTNIIYGYGSHPEFETIKFLKNTYPRCYENIDLEKLHNHDIRKMIYFNDDTGCKKSEVKEWGTN